MDKITKLLAIPTAIIAIFTTVFAFYTNNTVNKIKIEENNRNSLSFERDRDFKFKIFDYATNSLEKDEKYRMATIDFIQNIVDDELYKHSLINILVSNTKNLNIKNEIENSLNANDFEERAFGYLLNRNLDNAKVNFEKSYAEYPTLHNVDEINKLLKKHNSKELTTNENWIKLYKEIYPKYKWGMSTEIKNEFITKTQTL